MRNAGGYRIITEPGKADIENDTFTCAHCNGIVLVPAGTASITVGSTCLACMKHICEACTVQMDRTLKCVPFEKRLERIENKARLARSILGV